MFKNLEVFRTAGAMARHAGAAQSVTAANIANANTPGFKAQRIEGFQDTFQTLSTTPLKTTRAGHIGPSATTPSVKMFADPDALAAPNGNTVTIETEILKSIEAERQHSRALTIYESSLKMLKTSIGRGR